MYAWLFLKDAEKNTNQKTHFMYTEVKQITMPKDCDVRTHPYFGTLFILIKSYYK